MQKRHYYNKRTLVEVIKMKMENIRNSSMVIEKIG